MKVEIKKNRSINNWISGIIDTGDETFKFEAKVFDEPSVFGIPTNRFPDGGNVSKLCVCLNGPDWSNCVVNYDRGWDIAPGDDESLLDETTAESIIEAITDKMETICTDEHMPVWAIRPRY